MDSIGKFLDMGGYAGFVWPSYAAVFVVLAVLLWISLRGLRAIESELARLEDEQPRNSRRTHATDGAAQP